MLDYRRLGCFGVGLALFGCGAGPKPDPAPPCEAECQDGVALRGVRETLKLAFNLLVQGKPVGEQAGSTPCLSYDGSVGGSVRLSGTATSNAVQGSSFVDLVYDFDHCAYSTPPSVTAEQNYALVITGRIRQQGTLAVQPSSTTAVVMDSESLSVSGTVYDPAVEYQFVDCGLAIAQQGNRISGLLCGRDAGFVF
jgi:hypothetical protein